jgi:hypothetical protein
MATVLVFPQTFACMTAVDSFQDIFFKELTHYFAISVITVLGWHSRVQPLALKSPRSIMLLVVLGSLIISVDMLVFSSSTLVLAALSCCALNIPK